MDFDAPASRAGSTKSSSICMIALTTIAVAFRFWSRKVSSHAGLWWDDWLALVAWVLANVEFAFAFPLTSHGLGQHIGHVSEPNMHKVLLYVYVQEFFYNFALTFVKLSALAFYIRVFSMHQRWFRWAIWTTGALVMAWMTYTTFLGAFQCTPARKAWHPEVKGHCISDEAAYIATAAPNVVIDIMLLLMPIPFLKALHTTIRRKIGLGLIFVLGYCVPALSIARTIQASLLTTAKFEDFTWYTNPTAILFYLETGVGLISICLPATVYLARAFFKWTAKFPNLSPSQISMSIHGRRGGRMGPVGDPHDSGYGQGVDTSGVQSMTQQTTDSANAWSNAESAASTRRASEEEKERDLV